MQDDREKLPGYSLSGTWPSKHPNVDSEIPDTLIGFNFSKGRHSAQPDSILDDPEDFPIGIRLDVGRGKICRSRVHPPAGIGGIVPTLRGKHRTPYRKAYRLP